jgi:DNA-directed RNA polymerase specialized sigma24 family protein
LILHHFEGLSLPEVARQLERTVPSVEKLWARGLAAIPFK